MMNYPKRVIREMTVDNAKKSDDEHDGDSQIVKEWIALGGDAVGTTGGALLGFLLGGDAPGAAVGAAVGSLVSHALQVSGKEIWERYLTKRGKVRVARVIVLAANEMRNLLQTGARPRTDQFFTAQTPFRSHAEEIVEAVLLKAEREPEERKLPYIAKLLAHIPFESSIDVDMAHQLLRFAETLSYRQYCILELARDTSSFDLYDQSALTIGRDKLSDAQTSFLSDCWDLKGKGSFVDRQQLGP